MGERKTYVGSLHNHTQYSNLRLRDCIIKETDLIDYALELGHEVVAITDHEAICNSIKIEKYYNKIKEKNPNFKLIRGNEIYLTRNGLNNGNFVGGVDKYFHFILLAKNKRGHQQIREISTKAWKRSYMARGMRRVPTYYSDLIEIIGSEKGNVIGSTACLGGALPTQLLKYKELSGEVADELYGKIVSWVLQMDSLFGHGNFFLELQPSKNKEQIYVNKELLEISKNYDIPYIITTDSHYLKKSDRNIHKAYLNAQNGEREVDDFYATTYMMSTEELESYFDYLTEEELYVAYDNIRAIKDMCEDYSLQKPLYIPQLMWRESKTKYMPEYWYDKIPMFKTFMESDYEGDHQLMIAISEGIERHLDCQNQEAYDEINECLKMTWISSQKNNAHWSAYYLNLQNIIDECWNSGTIVGCGRGSGVGFILLYLLDITQINPLRETTKTYRWRFLNPDRVSVLDVDFDTEGGRRSQMLSHLRKVYGEDRVANVATFRTEKSKSAVLTAARGLGIDVDIAQYIAGLIPADRGLLRTLNQCMFGDKENDWAPVKQFVYEMTENYPELWEVARSIEGLVCGLGVHAGGIIFVDEPFTESTALMRAPDGTIITAFDLHDDEDVSLIKFDALSVEAMDKMHICIDLLCDYGYAERKDTLKETYESIIGIYNLERDDKNMWKMIWNHEITSLFQMEKQSGIQGIALAKPESVDDLATLNSVIRLMAQEKGGEQPLNKFARFKENIDLWYSEMREYGLTKEEISILEPVIKLSYGICESQEGFMQLVQIPECGGFDLTWADKLRKSIAKKNPAEYEKLTKEYFANVEEKGLSENLCNYVWNVLVATSRGYGFNKSHTLAYSLIALQEMNLAYKYPIIFWNCANLICDSGGVDIEQEDEEIFYEEPTYYNEMEDFTDEDEKDESVDSYEEEDCDGYPAEVITTTDGKKKKKVKSTNYGKIATALGKMKATGVVIQPPSINNSTFTFSPEIETNSVLFGLSGITRIGHDLITTIIENRPYSSIEDFLSKVKVNKTQMINLIKCGAFDEFGDRFYVMSNYIDIISDKKKRVTLQNMKMLIDFDLIPNELDYEKRLFNFNKYLKKFKDGTDYVLNDIAYNFYEKTYDLDLLREDGEFFRIKQVAWDKIYKTGMDIVRAYIKKNSEYLLNSMNKTLFDNMWNKYCLGNISKWEMDSVNCYFHEHELERVREHAHGFSDFIELSENPKIERIINIKGKQIPIFEIDRICGTVIDKDKAKKTVTLLTKSGVVTVRVFGAVFNYYDRQISEKGADGKKHVIEKSWFSRGNKVIITGMRREQEFVAKKYKNTPYHLCELITDINEYGKIYTQSERQGEEE